VRYPENHARDWSASNSTVGFGSIEWRHLRSPYGPSGYTDGNHVNPPLHKIEQM
jgi:hypothetical protein